MTCLTLNRPNKQSAGRTWNNHSNKQTTTIRHTYVIYIIVLLNNSNNTRIKTFFIINCIASTTFPLTYYSTSGQNKFWDWIVKKCWKEFNLHFAKVKSLHLKSEMNKKLLKYNCVVVVVVSIPVIVTKVGNIAQWVPWRKAI